MLYNYNKFIIEKSTLTSIGVPIEAMQIIEQEYNIDKEANWKRIKQNKEFIGEISKNEKALYIQISYDRIKIIINDYNNYYIQKFQYNDESWGEYIKHDKQYMTKTQIIKLTDTKDLVFKLLSDKFEVKPKKQRYIQKELKELFNITKDFKYNILKKFNNIVKRLYGKRYDVIMQKIHDNIEHLKGELTADELLKFLKDNQKLAKIAKEYEDAKNDDDLLRLKQLEKQYNSLSILDEYLQNFEVLYSDKYHTHLTIKELIKEFSLMQIENVFIYYLFTGKIKNLKI